MYNPKNYKILMPFLIFSIWVMYGLNWAFIDNNQLEIAFYISIIMDLSTLLLLTLIVVVLYHTLQDEREDKEYKRGRENKEYKRERNKTDKKKELEKELKGSGFDIENLKEYLKE